MHLGECMRSPSRPLVHSHSSQLLTGAEPPKEGGWQREQPRPGDPLLGGRSGEKTQTEVSSSARLSSLPLTLHSSHLSRALSQTHVLSKMTFSP